MSRAPRSGSMSRRRVLTVAASVGVGASVAGVAGLSLAGDGGAGDAEASGPLVISLRDARKGTFDLFTGDRKLTLTDRKLAAHLIQVARRG